MRPHAKKLMSGALLGATVLAGAAACGDDGVAVDAGGSSSTPATASTTAAPSPDPSSVDPEPTQPGGRMTEGLSTPLVLTRTGGIAGAKDRLVVRPDGTYEVTTRGTPPVSRQLSESQLASIVTVVQEADVAALAAKASATPTPSTTLPPNAQPDRFAYRISVGNQGFSTSETAAKGQVRALLDVLEPLFSAPAPTP